MKWRVGKYSLKILLLILLLASSIVLQVYVLETASLDFMEKWKTRTSLSMGHVAWMPNGYFLVAWDKHRIEVYSRTGSLQDRIEFGDDALITGVDTCYDNSHIAVTIYNKTTSSIKLLLYNIRSGGVDYTIAYGGVVNASVGCSKSYPKISVGLKQAGIQVYVYVIRGYEPVLDYRLELDESIVGLLSWSNDGVEISYATDNIIYVMSGVAPYRVKKIVQPKSSIINDYTWSPDNMYIAVALNNNKLVVYDVFGDKIWSSPTDSMPVSIAWVKNIVVVGFSDGTIALYKWLSNNTRRVYSYRTGLSDITDLSIDRSGSMLAILSSNGELAVYDVYGVLVYYSMPLTITKTITATITRTVFESTTTSVTRTYTTYKTATYSTRVTVQPRVFTITKTTTVTPTYTLTRSVTVTSTRTLVRTINTTWKTTITVTQNITQTLTTTSTTTLTSTITKTSVYYPPPRIVEGRPDFRDIAFSILIIAAMSIALFLSIRVLGGLYGSVQ